MTAKWWLQDKIAEPKPSGEEASQKWWLQDEVVKTPEINPPGAKTIRPEPATDLQASERAIRYERSSPEQKWLMDNGMPADFESLLAPIKDKPSALGSDPFTAPAMSNVPKTMFERFNKNIERLPKDDPLRVQATNILKLQEDLNKIQDQKQIDQGLEPERHKFTGFWDELKWQTDQFGKASAIGQANVISGVAGTIAENSESAIWDKDKVQALADRFYQISQTEGLQPEEAEGVSRVGQFVGSAIAGALPYMTATVGAGTIGGKIAGKVGQIAGGFGVGYAVEGESIKRKVLELGGTEEEADMHKLIFGSINGAVESLQVSDVIKFAKKGKGSAKSLIDAASKKAWGKVAAAGKDLTYEILELSLREALEEAIQEQSSITSEKIAGADISSAENVSRTGQAALGGAVVAPLLGGAGSINSLFGDSDEQPFNKPMTGEELESKVNEIMNREEARNIPQGRDRQRGVQVATTDVQELKEIHGQLYRQLMEMQEGGATAEQQQGLVERIVLFRDQIGHLLGQEPGEYPFEPPEITAARQSQAAREAGEGQTTAEAPIAGDRVRTAPREVSSEKGKPRRDESKPIQPRQREKRDPLSKTGEEVVDGKVEEVRGVDNMMEEELYEEFRVTKAGSTRWKALYKEIGIRRAKKRKAAEAKILARDQQRRDEEPPIAGTPAKLPPKKPPEKPQPIDKPTAEQRTELKEGLFETYEVPLDAITVSKDVPNFKEGADLATGVIPGQELQGNYERLGSAPIIVWKRKNGKFEVITGRHRLELARRSGEKSIPAQIIEEELGYDREFALTIDAQSNIRDEKGTVEDYAFYFKNTQIKEEEAKAGGLLSRSKGRKAFDISKRGIDNLYTGFINGKITADKAAAIARGAPNNEAAQNAALQQADRKSADELEHYAKILTRYTADDRKKASQGDLFGFDDSAIYEADKIARAVSKEVRSIKDRILAVKGALRRPETAKKMGLKFSDEASIREEVQRLEDRLDALSRVDTSPELWAEMREKAGLGKDEKDSPSPVVTPTERPETPKQVEVKTEPEPAKKKPVNEKRVAQFRRMADTLDKQITEKRRDMTQNPTPKRMREYKSRMHDADNLERLQKALRAMANAMEEGTLPAKLEGITKKADIQSLVRKGLLPGGYYDVILDPEYKDQSTQGKILQKMIEEGETEEDKAATAEREKKNAIKDAEEKFRFLKIKGFFPTPRAVIDEMMERAYLEEGQTILEPSAGKGDIADALKEEGHNVKVIEIRPALQNILEMKGHDVIGDDFLEHEGQYDRILMNPPFEGKQDIDHVQHAYKLLKPGGRLVAIMGEGAFGRSQKKDVAFREWLAEVGGISERLENAFKTREAFKQTGVASRMVEITKREADQEQAEAKERVKEKRAGRIAFDEYIAKTNVPGMTVTWKEEIDAFERKTNEGAKQAAEKMRRRARVAFEDDTAKPTTFTVHDIISYLKTFFNVNETEARAVAGLWFANAHVQGMGLEEWYDLHIADIMRETDKPGVSVKRTKDGTQVLRTTHKAATQFLDDGRAILKAFEQADVSSLVHETGHIFRRTLSKNDSQIAAYWAGAKDGKWNRAAEEKFARGFERYLRDGKAPNKTLRKIFENFKKWLTQIYKTLTGSPLDLEISLDIRGVFDRLLTKEVDYGEETTIPTETGRRPADTGTTGRTGDVGRPGGTEASREDRKQSEKATGSEQPAVSDKITISEVHPDTKVTLEKGNFIVDVEKDGKGIGYLTIEQDAKGKGYHIGQITVDPKYRRQGIATDMLKKANQWAYKKGETLSTGWITSEEGKAFFAANVPKTGQPIVQSEALIPETETTDADILGELGLSAPQAGKVEGVTEAISLGGGEFGGTVIHPSARTEGKIQATTFTKDGKPDGHQEYDTLEDALVDNIKDIDDKVFKPLKKAETRSKLVKAWEKAKFDSPLSPEVKGKKYAYVSPLRPLSGVSNLDGIVIDVDRVGVVFSDAPLDVEQVKHLSLVPITPEAQRASVREYITEQQLTPTPEATRTTDTDLLGKEEVQLEGGALGKQNEMFDKEDFKTQKEKDRINAEGDIEGQDKLFQSAQAPLDEHQLKGIKLAIDSLSKGQSFLLADGTGFGKTRQILAVAQMMQKRTGKPSLIITESKRIINNNFRPQSEVIGVDLDKIEIGTYSGLTSEKVGKGKYGVVIYDESHNLKNIHAKKSIAASKVQTDTEMFATATPMDSPTASAYFLSKITGEDRDTVANRLGYHFQTNYDSRGEPFEQAVLNEGNTWVEVIDHIADLRDLAVTQGNLIRREIPFNGTMEDQMVLPAADFHTRQTEIYAYWQRRIQAARGRRAKMNLGGQRTGELSRFTEAQKIDKVFNLLMKDHKDGKKVIIVAEGVNQTTIQGLLNETVPGLLGEFARRLEAKGIDYAQLFDANKLQGVQHRDSSKEVGRFQGDKDLRIALMTPKTGGAGIDLDDSIGDDPRTMYVVTTNYSGDVFDQVLGRVSRRNTKSPATLKFVKINRAISDEKRADIIDRKLKTLRAIQRGVDLDRAYGFEVTDDQGRSTVLYQDQSANIESKSETPKDVQKILTRAKNLAPLTITKGQKDAERLIDRYHYERDIAKQEAKTDAMNYQNDIKEAMGDGRHSGWRKRHKQMDMAMQVYVDLKNNPAQLEYYDDLTITQQEIVLLAQKLPAPIKAIADRIIAQNNEIGLATQDIGIIHNVIENYSMRQWVSDRIPEERRKFGTATGRARHRTLEGILHGWSLGKELAITGITNAQKVMRTQISNTKVDRQLLKTGKDWGLISTNKHQDWKRIEHPNFTDWKWAGKVEKGRTYGTNFFSTPEGNLMERVPMYAPADLAKHLNKLLGTSALYKLPGVRTATEWNARLKRWVLFTSFFHHQAYIRSYALGGRTGFKDMSKKHSYDAGRTAIENFTPALRKLVGNGLTLGEILDYDETAIRGKGTIFGRILRQNVAVDVAVGQLEALRDWNEHLLFSKMSPFLKAQAALLEYKHLLNKHKDALANGSITEDEIAKQVANLINDDFGGLHLGRMGRNPTLQHIFRLLALAPDWTESNVRSAIKAFKMGEEGRVYRAFWARIATKGLTAMVLFNLLMAMYDEEDEDWKAAGSSQRFLNNYRKAWALGKLRWLDVDVTPIYKALGGKANKRKYFSLLGHFKDPIKFIARETFKIGKADVPDVPKSLLISAKYKGSILSRIVADGLTGTNYAGREFTTLSELMGVDDKGTYKNNRRGVYKKGDPKGGKLKGELTKWTLGGKTALGLENIPSFLIYQGKSNMPIQAQNAISYLNGQIDGFDAIIKSSGTYINTTYSPYDKYKNLSRNELLRAKAANTYAKTQLPRSKGIIRGKAHKGKELMVEEINKLLEAKK